MYERICNKQLIISRYLYIHHILPFHIFWLKFSETSYASSLLTTIKRRQTKLSLLVSLIFATILYLFCFNSEYITKIDWHKKLCDILYEKFFLSFCSYWGVNSHKIHMIMSICVQLIKNFHSFCNHFCVRIHNL